MAASGGCARRLIFSNPVTASCTPATDLTLETGQRHPSGNIPFDPGSLGSFGRPSSTRRRDHRRAGPSGAWRHRSAVWQPLGRRLTLGRAAGQQEAYLVDPVSSKCLSFLRSKKKQKTQSRNAMPDKAYQTIVNRGGRSPPLVRAPPAIRSVDAAFSLWARPRRGGTALGETDLFGPLCGQPRLTKCQLF